MTMDAKAQTEESAQEREWGIGVFLAGMHVQSRDGRFGTVIAPSQKTWAELPDRSIVLLQWDIGCPNWTPEADLRHVESAQERERLLAELSPRDRKLVEHCVSDYPRLTAAEVIEELWAFGGL